MSAGPIKLSLSVRELVEFSAASGDLFADQLAGPTALEGIRAHQMVQKSRGPQWLNEEKLSATVERKGCILKLGGRVDLLLHEAEQVTVEEIKTTYLPPEKLAGSQLALHWAQVKLYAWLYAQQEDLLKSNLNIICRATWFNLPEQQEYSDDQTYDFNALELFAQELIDRYLDWYVAWRGKLDRERSWAKSLNFPFTNFRDGQRELASDVYRAIKNKKHLLVEATTGTGKSMSTLFPAVKSYGEGELSQLVYLSAKGSAQQNAVAAVEVMNARQAGLGYLCIQAKERACACRSSDENRRQSCFTNSGKCKRSIGFFDRLPQARLECLNSPNLSVERLQHIADQYELCAFELSLQMIRWSSLVVCDLNYVFDPLVRLAVFEKNSRHRVILCDEAHNFVDRSRDMFSAELSAKDCIALSKALPKQAHSFRKALVSLAGTLEHYSGDDLKTLTKIVSEVASILGQEAANVLTTGLSENQPEGLAEFSKAIYRFMCISQLAGDEHCILFENGTVALRCLDSARHLKEQYKKARAFIGFSATLSPMNFYARMLGLKDHCFSHHSPSSFPPENQLSLRCDYIDTRWQQRESSIGPLCNLIHLLAESKPGKYMVFFPSYAYLEKVKTEFVRRFPQLNVVEQKSDSNEGERSAFLSYFGQDQKPVIGFAILGGVFGEGVDYAGEALSGLIVVGAGMPQPDELNGKMQDYFNSLGLNGFQYTYQFPGLTRVQQTAGRVIRSEQDRGVVVLVDPRFKQSQYAQHLPASWDLQPCDSEDVIGRKLDDFWAEDFVLSDSQSHDE